MLRFILIFILFFSPLLAKVVLSNNVTYYNDFTIKYLYDKNKLLTIENVANMPFEKTTSNSFTFGYLSGITWFKIELENISDTEDYVLSFSEVIWKTFDIYHEKNETWTKKTNGLDIPLVQREIQDVNPAFNLYIDKNSTKTFYIRGQTISGQLGRFDIYAHDEYFNPTRINMMSIYISFAFMLLGILFLNIYSLILTRELSYAYYIIYIITSIAFSSMHSGSYLILGLNGWNEGLHVVGSFLVLMLLFFTDRFLEFKKEFPLFHKFFMFSAIIISLFIILIYNNVAFSSLLFNLYSIIFFIMLFIGVVKIFLKGSMDVKYYLLVLIVYLPLLGLMVATFNTLLPYSDFTRHAFVVGAFVEIMLFTLILTSRYNTINHEKIRIQKELLYEKGKNELYLEAKIAKRTKELELLASTDSLTKLFNRRYFMEMSESILELTKRNNTSLSIMMADIDNFKCINDTYGHAIGDKVIIMVANILKEYTRKSDIVARWGGEEFITLFPQTTIEGTLKIAQKIRTAIEEETVVLADGKEIKFTISIGVDLVDINNDSNLEAAINRSDKALYKAKDGGRNMVCKYLS